MVHIVLLGDSILDNGFYTPDQASITEQVRQGLPEASDRVTCVATDGNYIRDIPHQLTRVPADATHLVVSIGGNDVLGYVNNLEDNATSMAQILATLSELQLKFSQAYRSMLSQVCDLRRPLVLCTIYDHIPPCDPHFRSLIRTLLPVFNDCITRHAIALGLPIIDLRLICKDLDDYSTLSPVEPSAQGGEKIAQRILHIVQTHDFSSPNTHCYR
jgi:hypothetical protein